MKILVIGGGGREHAIVHTLRKSPRVSEIHCAPGNGGISEEAVCVPIKATDIPELVEYAKTGAFDLVVVAPDDPLALGLVDRLEEAGIRAFGPKSSAAIVESSKSYAKSLMKRYGIPTAAYEVFSDIDAALEYVGRRRPPIVIKADGLALGKGVTIAKNRTEAEDALYELMKQRRFGTSGDKVVIEEFMTGPEVTVMCFTDGKTIVAMPSAQDHKRAFDRDLGPNTGGMGAFSPSPNYTPEIEKYCMENIYLPTIEALRRENRLFKGVLYFGLMLTSEGPKVVEYNARFGDPETQAVLPMLRTDLLDIFEAIINERLSEINIEWEQGSSCCVVMCSGGYPMMYDTGFEITGLDSMPEDIFVFHSGTSIKNGLVLTDGGRVLGVTAWGENLAASINRAYDGVSRLSFPTKHYRTDIGRIYVTGHSES